VESIYRIYTPAPQIPNLLNLPETSGEDELVSCWRRPVARAARSGSRNPGARLLRVRLFKVEPWTVRFSSGKLWSGSSTPLLIAAAIIEVVRVVVIAIVVVVVVVVVVVRAPP